jgi:hypothetical protein
MHVTFKLNGAGYEFSRWHHYRPATGFMTCIDRFLYGHGGFLSRLGPVIQYIKGLSL